VLAQQQLPHHRRLGGKKSSKPDNSGTRRELTPGNLSLWEWLDAPYGREVETALAKARENLDAARAYNAWEYGGGINKTAAQNRARLLNDAEGMLRYGLKLIPGHLPLLFELGRVTDENGKLEAARQALEAYLAAEAAEQVQPEAHWRLGRLYAREGKWDEATAQLRLALGSDRSDSLQTAVLFTLAEVYMQSGHMEDAIDLLQHAVTNPHLSLWSNNQTLAFALAVAYDRDEQVTMANETLGRIVAGNQVQNLLQVLIDPASGRLVFTPAYDRHYFDALQYEAMGNLVEARSEWRAYAAFGELAPFRGRALEHVHDIDRILARKRGKNREASGPTNGKTSHPQRGVKP
jgi:tetratricopeptide (TPR) repeat protein